MRMRALESLTQRARQLKAETVALYHAARHPATPWYAKLLVAAVVAYALSPIDLIPDFIPVLGYLDDLIVLPLGIALALRMIRPNMLEECRGRARETLKNGKPVSWAAAVVIVLIWILLVTACAVWVFRVFG